LRRLAGVAAIILCWPPDVFWRSTPHEFWTAMEVKEEQQRAAQAARAAV